MLPFSLSRRRLAVAAATVSLLALTLLLPLPVPTAAPQARLITIEARQFGYQPATLRVNRGDTVTVRLQSLDSEHGLYIDGYGVNINAEPGRSAEATFVADRPGDFKLRCSAPCGALHPFMIGQLQVEPNLPLVRVVVLAVLAALGATIFFWI